MKISSTALMALFAAWALTACNDEAKDTHPDKLVTQRRVLFKEFTRTLEPMGLVARDRKDYNPREFNVSALALQKIASQPWPLFTPDSNYPPTHAKAAVWLKAAAFKAAQDDYRSSVDLLVTAAQGDDLNLIKNRVNEVQKNCKSCHEQFRNDAGS